MNYADILKTFQTYSDDHPIKELMARQSKPFPSSYIDYLAKALLHLDAINNKAAHDYLEDKIGLRMTAPSWRGSRKARLSSYIYRHIGFLRSVRSEKRKGFNQANISYFYISNIIRL